jgi:hypothetical protein
MIVNIAGTNGSGKTYAVRALLEQSRLIEKCPGNQLWKEFGRLIELTPGRTIFVMGRYDSFDTGGADTIKDVGLMYQLISEHAIKGEDVVYEGSFAMNHTRGIQLVNEMKKVDIPVSVIYLTTPLDVCKASINERRKRRGDPPFPRSWRLIDQNVTRARNFTDKLRWSGATVYKLERHLASQKLIELLKQ